MIRLQDIVAARDSLKGKVKDTTLPAKKNPRIKFSSGADQQKSDGQGMEKERVIDKVTEHYEEKVIDPETGAVVHHTSEPSPAHRNHGTAKFRREP